MTQELTAQDRAILLKIARDAIGAKARREALPDIQSYPLSPALLKDGASFVTLSKEGRLRGCIGSLEASQSLAQDVQDHAIQAAFDDPRFPSLQAEELPHIHIEISHISPLQVLTYKKPKDLAKALKPHQDGVILKTGYRRATFLPQVWEQLPKPEDFLGHLCQKMGMPADFWKTSLMEVFTYTVEAFEE